MLTSVLVVLSLTAFASTSSVYDNQKEISVIEQDFVRNDDGSYSFHFVQDDGQERKESSQVIPGYEPEEGSIDVRGQFVWVGQDGKTYRTNYVANENGFQPEADHLPQAPAQLPEYEQHRNEHPELYY